MRIATASRYRVLRRATGTRDTGYGIENTTRTLSVSLMAAAGT